MAMVFFIVFGTITAFLAKRKGYNPYIWFFAAGVIGLIVLAFLPFANAEILNDEQKKAKRERGNLVAGIIIVLALIFLVFNFILSKGKSVELKKEAKKASCLVTLGKIRIALSSYYARKASSSSNEKEFFPSSLHDAEFLNTLSSVFEGGKLPEHLCGKDWNDFYNPENGILDMEAACDCK